MFDSEIPTKNQSQLALKEMQYILKNTHNIYTNTDPTLRPLIQLFTLAEHFSTDHFDVSTELQVVYWNRQMQNLQHQYWSI